ncbi:hypothetical protein NDU88_004422 [Pleurodeles waltl]|uniref:Uncharacterized protein n=1 Tax=Pleurodeles waltl TaxID=8319 RepID=A0AAV7MGL1_PLEWA|nr:hypothetical protein NDU88_004422 [Pleurodeles waltl]
MTGLLYFYFFIKAPYCCIKSSELVRAPSGDHVTPSGYVQYFRMAVGTPRESDASGRDPRGLETPEERTVMVNAARWDPGRPSEPSVHSYLRCVMA